jgi:hypothetical protein
MSVRNEHWESESKTEDRIYPKRICAFNLF